ncbi:uncharacterized protein LOC133035945 [Cannabis sativa]|uniref:uncharacterized protein LOC133035945 n=1 Tax=Cannabis sativa TaxID=3483 RepID=UPI0029CA1492|nr:uncharacterized protein LOC133035945 [Cannabis sativa]
MSWETLSDHCSYVVSSAITQDIGIKPFRFYNHWTEHENFVQVVIESWVKPIKASGLLVIHLKCLQLKHVLRNFNKIVGDVEFTYQQAKDNYLSSRHEAQSDPGNISLLEVEKAAAEELCNRDKMLHSFLKQRSKVTWLQKGDENNAYFYACIKKRREENWIAFFKNQNDEIVDDYSEVVKHFMDHFTSFMGSARPDYHHYFHCLEFGNKLSLDQQLLLTRPFTRK